MKRVMRMFLWGAAAWGLSAAVSANERHFTYTYESAVMAPGHRELELWTTYRNGRATPANEYLFSQFEHRMEFEMGLTNDLLTAFYLNWKTATVEELDMAGVKQGESEHEFEFQGISSEWKLKLADPVADAVGFALYGEVGLGDHEAELEAKLIFDKRIGNWLLAYNFVLEKEFEFEPDETEEETAIENVLGIAHVFDEKFSLGLEARQHAEFIPNDPAGDPEHVAWFLGPALSYTGPNWWIAATCLFQLPALQRSAGDPGRGLVLDEHERINARVILSWEL